LKKEKKRKTKKCRLFVRGKEGGEGYRLTISVAFTLTCSGSAAERAVALRPRMVTRVLVNNMLIVWRGIGGIGERCRVSWLEWK